jgi:hypothetical protein
MTLGRTCCSSATTRVVSMLVYSALVKMCMKKRDSICRVARSRKDLPSRADRSLFLSGDLRAAATNKLAHLTSTTIKGKSDFRGPGKDHFSG